MTDKPKLSRCRNCRVVAATLDAEEFAFCPRCGKPSDWQPVEVDLAVEERPQTALERMRAQERPTPANPSTSFPDPEAPRDPVVFAPSWAEFHRDCRAAVQKLGPAPVSVVLGIARGGMVPAAIVAHLLGVEDVRVVRVHSYNRAREQGNMMLGEGADLGHLGEGGAGVLIVDDLVDTGTTMAWLGNCLPAAIRLAVYAKPRGAGAAHLYARPVEQKVWIRFPWETE